MENFSNSVDEIRSSLEILVTKKPGLLLSECSERVRKSIDTMENQMAFFSGRISRIEQRLTVLDTLGMELKCVESRVKGIEERLNLSVAPRLFAVEKSIDPSQKDTTRLNFVWAQDKEIKQLKKCELYKGSERTTYNPWSLPVVPLSMKIKFCQYMLGVWLGFLIYFIFCFYRGGV